MSTTTQPPKIVSLALALEDEQSTQILKLVENRKGRTENVKPVWFTLSRKLHPGVVLELDTKIVRVKRDSIEVPELSAFKMKTGYTLRGFHKESDRLFLVWNPEGWTVDVHVGAIARVKRVKTNKKSKRNELAVRFVSGGAFESNRNRH